MAAIMTAAAVCVVAASFAVYALIRAEIGPAGAAACVAGIFALFAVIVANIARGLATGKSRKGARDRDPIALAERLVELVRERPWAAGIVSVGVALAALRSPAIMEAVARAF